MLAQFQFLSFYKLTNTTAVSKDLVPFNTLNKIFTTNIQIIYILIFLNIYNETTTKKKKTLSFFCMPVKKKKTIFLRAPYKNKLARLNIINVSYKFIVSLNFEQLVNHVVVTTLFRNLNLSSHKIMHYKTKIHYYENNAKNFLLNNYN